VKSNSIDWVGVEIARGRYKILGRVGRGSMGQVFRAFDHHLDAEVVLKFPVIAPDVTDDQGFLKRFQREIRSLVTLSHPHIVKVIDVGEHEAVPYVVLQHLAGGSLKDRMATGPGGEFRPMPVGTLAEWLPDIARALDFIHSQDHVHRDVKPANILFDRHGNAFLGDFGIIKALTSETADCQGNSLTAPGFLVGTPNYVAPEIVMGRAWDGRVDQYSLAMSVHEVLTGNNCMEGPTPSATVVNQTIVVPPPLSELIPDVSPQISHAILRGLAKDPGERFASCLEMAQEIMAGIPAGSRAVVPPLNGLTARGEPGKVPCPSCGAISPAGREHAGNRVRCMKCQAVSYVQILSRNTIQLKLVEYPPGRARSVVIDSPDEDEAPDPSAATVQTNLFVTDAGAPAVGPGRVKEPTAIGRRWLLAGVLAMLAVAAAIGLARPWSRSNPGGARPTAGDVPPASAGAGLAPQPPPSPNLAPAVPTALPEINIAYGTEKQRWLEQATEDFRKTEEGKQFKVNLHGMGSMEGAQAVMDGPGTLPIHVWSPASGAYRDLFELEWAVRHAGKPILKAENLALTPMVFVFWKERREAFLRRFARVDFETIGRAMGEPGGWGAIAGRPDWGGFKFSHTHPNLSNSGLLTLVLMDREHARAAGKGTSPGNPTGDLLSWLRDFERGVARPGGSLSHSTGTLMREMVLRGPSQYDCLLVYENLAIDYLEAARDRFGELHVDYPDPNLWNEHPFYILDVPWSSPEQRSAAASYLRFLMSEPVQKQALEHGFRPGNPAVSVRFLGSPLVRHAAQGLKVDLPQIGEPPKAESLRRLLEIFSQVESALTQPREKP
jgi:serine/threonine-protein kinase